jgi:hypothetical protein
MSNEKEDWWRDYNEGKYGICGSGMHPYFGYSEGSAQQQGYRDGIAERKRDAELANSLGENIAILIKKIGVPLIKKIGVRNVIIIMCVLIGLGLVFSAVNIIFFPPKTVGAVVFEPEVKTGAAPYILISHGVTTSPSVIQVTRVDRKTVKLVYLGGPTENKLQYISWQYCQSDGCRTPNLGDPKSTSPLPVGSTLYLNNVAPKIRLYGMAEFLDWSNSPVLSPTIYSCESI